MEDERAGSGKSYFAVQKMLIKALKDQRKMLVIRKVTATLRDSIFAEFQSAIRKFGLYDSCKVVTSLLTIELPNGSQFIFKGMDDPEKIKSISGIGYAPSSRNIISVLPKKRES